MVLYTLCTFNVLQTSWKTFDVSCLPLFAIWSTGGPYWKIQLWTKFLATSADDTVLVPIVHTNLVNRLTMTINYPLTRDLRTRSLSISMRSDSSGRLLGTYLSLPRSFSSWSGFGHNEGTGERYYNNLPELRPISVPSYTMVQLPSFRMTWECGVMIFIENLLTIMLYHDLWCILNFSNKKSFVNNF